MLATSFPYFDAELDEMDRDAPPPPYWRHFHWGYFTEPDVRDDSVDRYVAAAEGLTERLIGLAGVTDNRAVLDVGCGFGGTLDHIRARNGGCQLYGLNIDYRQVHRGRQLLASYGLTDGDPVTFVTADACTLPFPDNTFDHLLAVECIFHFPSRKAFFREAARVLKPGGTLALSDFVLADGASVQVAANLTASGIGGWYGHYTRPLTVAGYARLARGTGFDTLSDEDITTNTLPTYPAIRRIYKEAGQPDGVSDIDGLETLATGGGYEYHLLAYKRREAES
jgi:ubiquinone/menaquinone biosynthesis C-methylase UbiE